MDGKKKVIDGVITLGLGEGTYFMSMKHYKAQIKKKLGFDSYPGTLNLEININASTLLKDTPSVKICGFKSNNKKFGGAVCYRAKLKDVEGAIIIPEVNQHKKNILEFIAPAHLKSELKLKDGDKVKVELIQ